VVEVDGTVVVDVDVDVVELEIEVDGTVVVDVDVDVIDVDGTVVVDVDGVVVVEVVVGTMHFPSSSSNPGQQPVHATSVIGRTQVEHAGIVEMHG
jgi:hypothetical protein